MRHIPLTATVEGRPVAMRLVACEVATVMATDHLSAWERVRYDGFTSPSRRNTFLAGRIAAKESAAFYVGHDRLTGASIENDRRGCPGLYIAAEAAPAFISISHTQTLAAGLASPPACRIGIDLMLADTRFPKGMDHLLTAEEKTIFADGRCLAEGLAAREALAKHTGQGFAVPFDTYAVEKLTVTSGRVTVAFRNFPHVRAEVIPLGDHFLAVACDARHQLRLDV